MQRRLAPRKSDGDGAPSLPWGNERAAARVGCVSTFREEKVGTPRRRGPKFQATQSPLGDAVAVGGCRGGIAAKMGRRRRAIPTIENERAAARERGRLSNPQIGEAAVSLLLIAPCLSSAVGPKRHSESKREAGADRSGTGFFVSLLKSQAAIGASACFAALRRFTKTYPPMPARRSRLAATWSASFGAGIRQGPGGWFSTLGGRGFEAEDIRIPLQIVHLNFAAPTAWAQTAESQYRCSPKKIAPLLFIGLSSR